MSNENQEVEQITKPPTNTPAKPNKSKDPKKVAAGRKLAEYNKKAKEALKKEMKREEEQSTEGTSDSWIPEISFTTALSLAGIGLTVFDLITRYRARTVSTGIEGYRASVMTEGCRANTATEGHRKSSHNEVQNNRAESRTREEGLVNSKSRPGME